MTDDQPYTVEFAVNGTLMRGLELNQNLLDVGAVFVREDRTVPQYRLWTIDDRHPGMIRTTGTDGAAIELEVWMLRLGPVAEVLLAEPPGLTVGKVRLESGVDILGVLAEPALVQGQTEITQFGGWRAYLTAKERGAAT
jgi:hypothetical protein